MIRGAKDEHAPGATSGDGSLFSISGKVGVGCLVVEVDVLWKLRGVRCGEVEIQERKSKGKNLLRFVTS